MTILTVSIICHCHTSVGAVYNAGHEVWVKCQYAKCKVWLWLGMGLGSMDKVMTRARVGIRVRFIS